MVPAECLSSNPLGAEAKFWLSASQTLEGEEGGLGGGPGGGGGPPTVYGRSNTSLEGGTVAEVLTAGGFERGGSAPKSSSVPEPHPHGVSRGVPRAGAVLNPSIPFCMCTSRFTSQTAHHLCTPSLSMITPWAFAKAVRAVGCLVPPLANLWARGQANIRRQEGGGAGGVCVPKMAIRFSLS